MKTAWLFVFCVLTPFLLLYGQSDYTSLECEGKIPREFITTSQSKYLQVTKNVSKGNQKRYETRALKRFQLESQYNLDNLLRSGRVLFNDEVSNYLTDVTNEVLKARPLTGKHQVKVYTLRSSAVNAFASDRGEVFVTLGLIAQLENEAQLAYIIAHELAHIEKKHGVNLHVASARLEKKESRSVLARASTDDKLLALASYSKENENEADRLGLERILQSPYRTATLPVVYDVLKYSYLPFDDLPFDRNILQSDNYRLPDTYWLDWVKPIVGEDEEEDDKHSTHPNLQSRRQAMLATLNKHTDSPEKSDYVVSAERFERVRNLARNEMPFLCLHYDQHAAAIYNAALLLRERPGDVNLKKCIAKALYLHAKLTNSKVYEYEGSYEEVEGQSQQLHYLLEHLSAKEATVLALHYAWNLHNAIPEDGELQVITEDLFFELARNHDGFAGFINSPPAEKPQVPIAVSDTTSTELKPKSKYDRIRGQKAEKPQSDNYWQYAFAGQLTTERFLQLSKQAEQKADEWNKNSDYYATKQGKKELKRLQKKGLSLGIPKVVVINPFYLKLDERKDENVQYIDTEQGQENFQALIKEVATISGLRTTLLDVRSLKENQTEAFNDIRYLNDWFSEQSRHFDLTLTPGNQQARIDSIAQQYGTDYFLWTGVISLRAKNNPMKWLYVAPALLSFPPAAPFLAYNAAKPNYEMLHYAILYDVRTGRRQVLKFDVFKQKDSDAIVKAHLYDAFFQIKRKE